MTYNTVRVCALNSNTVLTCALNRNTEMRYRIGHLLTPPWFIRFIQFIQFMQFMHSFSSFSAFNSVQFKKTQIIVLVTKWVPVAPFELI